MENEEIQSIYNTVLTIPNEYETKYLLTLYAGILLKDWILWIHYVDSQLLWYFLYYLCLMANVYYHFSGHKNVD